MRKSFLKRRRNDFLFLLIYCCIQSIRLIPRTLGLQLFSFVGSLVYRIPTRETQRTRENLQRIYGQTWSQQQIDMTASKVYKELGKNVFDAFYLSMCSNKKFFSLVTFDETAFTCLEDVYKQGKGVVVVAAHLGCFELQTQCVVRKGMQCITIGQRLFDQRVDRLISRLRSSNTIVYLHRDGSSKEILRRLKKGYIFGSLIDQDTNVDGVFAHFLGIPAYTPSGPVRIAMLQHTPIFTMYTARQADDTHTVFISGPMQIPTSDDPTKDLVLTIEQINTIFSQGIELYPTQWVWMHRRWHSSPLDPRYETKPHIATYGDMNSKHVDD